MNKESLGYVELEWVCPFCNVRNPGRAKVCKNCNAPQPKDVQFQQAAEDKIVKDKEALESIAAGPDIHCPFCGTRNRGDAKVCSRCGGDLVEAEKRESGQVIGPQQTGPIARVICPYCQTDNPATNLKCVSCKAPLHQAPRPQPQAAAPATRSGGPSQGVIIGGGLSVLLLLAAMIFFFMRGNQTDTYSARVNDVGWKRTIAVLGLVPVSYQAWADQIPTGATVNYCQQRQRGTSYAPTANSTRVCGTPFLVDQGSGFAEMVQECYYLVYDNYCEYSAVELRPIGVFEESGTNMNPFWPETRLSQGQQLGERQEVYQINFTVDGQRYSYQTRNFNEFSRFTPGSNWDLEINGFGNIVSIEPAR